MSITQSSTSSGLRYTWRMENQPPRQGLTPQEQAQIQLIMNNAQAEDAGVSAVSPETGFSVAALAYGPVYFWAMGDKPFAFLSLVCMVVIWLAPGIIVLAFLARRRAWESKPWRNVIEFNAAQKRWDQSAWFVLIITVVALVLSYHYLKPLLTSSLEGAGFGSGSSASDQLKQAQSVINDN